MAGLIVKSPYLKCGGGSSVSGYLRYIGTRERVEIIPDDRPPTRKQEQLITKLTKDFPEAKELGEYSDYKDKPTKANASVFITRALEENWFQVQQSDGYMKYIATRPRAERLGDHGLFGDEDAVDLEKTMRELDQYSGNVWTHILSLKREDAARLGYDNAKAWRNLLRANRNDIAAAMNIQPNHFHWYAAFHDEGKHPHVHMMAWSTVPGEAYLTRDGIRNIKSALTNQIFKQEMLHTYEQKSQSRDELVREARRAIRQLTQEMAQSICTAPEIEQKMEQLVGQLETVKRKSSGRSKTLSFRRRSASGWARSLSRTMAYLKLMNRNMCGMSPKPAGSCGASSGTRTFLWTTVTGRQRSWSRLRSAATPMRNTGGGSSTEMALC